MISLSTDFDLGRDATRMKDPRDAIRQRDTAAHLLERFFTPVAQDRWELQLLADEVGMGKTFVALGVAYSVLQGMLAGTPPADLEGCYRKVLILAPGNHMLFRKWTREVGEFLRRCVEPSKQQSVEQWFSATPVERIDDLVKALRRPGVGPSVVVAKTTIFGGQRLMNLGLKRRFTLGVLFRCWGNRFVNDARHRLLKGAPEDWGLQATELTSLTDKESDQLPFNEDEMRRAIDRLESTDFATRLDSLLECCKEVSALYVRNRDELFRKHIDPLLTEVYREVCAELIRSDLPLVIVDEAHNWKNGPAQNTNGYEGFKATIACRARRLLLLTATPFQLRPSEILELLRISDDMKPAAQLAPSALRRERLREHRDKVIRPVLQNAADASRRFAKAWSKLPRNTRTQTLQEVWESAPLVAARTNLRKLAEERGAVTPSELEAHVNEVVAELGPDIRAIFREALKLFAYNSDLSAELGKQVVRHRRNTDHRLVRVGEEFQRETEAIARRTDRHVLHAASGLDVSGDGELPHYLLMRCVTEMHRSERKLGRTSLGSALTGCYSTLLGSAEGRTVKKALAASEAGRMYFDLLEGMVSEASDPDHPKLKAVVDRVIEAWHAGEKSLLFCFRSHTAKRLREILSERIAAELSARRNRCLGGEKSLRALRGRMTRRDGDLIGLGLDRVLWSYAWALRQEVSLDQFSTSLKLTPPDVVEVARLALTYGVDLGGEDMDRVFLNRVTEHVIARRLLLAPHGLSKRWKAVLERAANPEWVERPYGVEPERSSAEAGDELPGFDERGVHSVYAPHHSPTEMEVERLALELQRRREHARKGRAIPVLDAYAEGPSLWLGGHPLTTLEGAGLTRQGKLVATFHEHLERISVISDEQLDWLSRLHSMRALRQAVLRESVLVRLLPERTEREESGWGELLVDAFFTALPSQTESMADRIAVFLEDVRAAGGSVVDPKSMRYAMIEATRLREGTFVALVQGSTDQETRERYFAGFNTPLLPEVLVCTSVGAEGIDLHRHCRHIIHYDLAWNPAVLEQRTGRIDRIGSKTFREREATRNGANVYLDVAVPFLAGTYDERMFEELRIRAQMFEVLTGGTVSADSPESERLDESEGRDEGARAEGESADLSFVALPPTMVDELRVRLHVWTESAEQLALKTQPPGESAYA